MAFIEPSMWSMATLSGAMGSLASLLNLSATFLETAMLLQNDTAERIGSGSVFLRVSSKATFLARAFMHPQSLQSVSASISLPPSVQWRLTISGTSEDAVVNIRTL